MTTTFTDTATAFRDWLRDKATAGDLNTDSDRIDFGTQDGDDLFIRVVRVGGGEDRGGAPIDQALLQIDVMHGTSYNEARAEKNRVRGLLFDLRTQALNTGAGATTGYGARVQSEVFLPDPSDNSPRFVLTVEATARAT